MTRSTGNVLETRTPAVPELWQRLNPPPDALRIFERAPSVRVAGSTQELIDSACGDPGKSSFEVAYDVPGKGRVVEAHVIRVRNGICANYPEPYMRRRDPDSMVLGDDLPSNKPHYRDVFGTEFDQVRHETFDWLASQELVAFAFLAGQDKMGMDALVVAPSNAGFFALALGLLQGIREPDALPEQFDPKLILYVAPPFRHTHFKGKQIVVHNRSEERHEIFSYNLYPGPSAKKGVYGGLINLGEREGWITAHCSAAQVVTPYDNVVTIMHEGASGGGKSEMTEQAHRESDGRWLIGRNLLTGERRYLAIPRGCEIRPVADDMALCHPLLQKEHGKLCLMDAEDAWFVRVNHIDQYATDPQFEKLTAQPPEPLLFLNIDAVPTGRALIWEHIEDSPGKVCPNPRVIIPRRCIPNIVNGAVTVDIRSLGVRTPPCCREHPTYGILGLFHVLPPALAWLWRLVAPRGYANPSISDSESLESEGVGSYWPFATGRQIEHANLILRQIQDSPATLFILCPNQHVGCWYSSFMPQWVTREYLARRGVAKFRKDQIQPARCALLGYVLDDMTVEGTTIPKWLLQVNAQPEVGEEGYDTGAAILERFFDRNLRTYDLAELDPLGRRIVDMFFAGGSAQEYTDVLPSEWIPRV